jgi:hypothetical protein
LDHLCSVIILLQLNTNLMKQLKFLLILIALFIMNSGFTQGSSNTHIGIKGGANFSNLFVDEIDDQNVLIGYHFGVFSKFNLSNLVSVLVEAQYTTKGAKLTYGGEVLGGTAKFSLKYIEVPVLMVLQATPNFNIHAGPYIAYLIGGKVTNESDVTLFDFENNINTDNFNKLDAGLAAGLGLDFNNFSLGARYYYGMTVVGKEGTFNELTYTFPDGKNSLFSVYLAVALN